MPQKYEPVRGSMTHLTSPLGAGLVPSNPAGPGGTVRPVHALETKGTGQRPQGQCVVVGRRDGRGGVTTYAASSYRRR